MYNIRYFAVETTRNNPIILSHNNFLEPMLIHIMRISVGHIHFQATLIFE